MSCINNIDRLIIPNDIIVQLTKVYRYIGMNKEFANVFASDLDVVISQTVERYLFLIANFRTKINGYENAFNYYQRL